MITIDDLKLRFGTNELKQLSHSQNYDEIDEAVINQAIDDACSLIESYLNPTGLLKRGQDGKLIFAHATSQTTTPKALAIHACDIARYYLYENGASETVEKRYQQAIDWLKLVSANPTMLTGKTDNKQAKTGIYVIANAKPDMWKI